MTPLQASRARSPALLSGRARARISDAGDPVWLYQTGSVHVVTAIHKAYDCCMQIAVVIPDEQVDALDRLVPAEFSSRAEAVRTAVSALLTERRRSAADERYEAAYANQPAQVDDIDGGRQRRGQDRPGDVWADLDW